MLEKMCLELEKKFKCRFIIKDTDGLIEIVCSDKDIEDSEEAIEEIIKIGSKYLEESRLWDIGVVYDYLGELPCKEVAKVFSQERVMMQSTSCIDIKINKYMKNLIIPEKDFEIIPLNKINPKKSKITGFKEKTKYKIEKLITNIIESKREEECKIEFANNYRMCI